MFESLLVGNDEEPTTAYGLLAEDVEVAPDLRSATFRIRPEARFNDGSPVLAADVVHSFETLVGKLAAPQFRTIYAEVKGVKALGERTVRFDFLSDNRELPLVVGGMAVFSRAWGAGKPFDQINTELPIASGPYMPASARLGRDITYVRRPDYWGAKLAVRKGHYNFDRVTYKLYLDETARFEGLKAGEFDFMREFVSRNWARQYYGKAFDTGELKKQAFENRNPGDFQGYIFNLRNPKFQDIRVRQAIGLTMDFEWLNRQMFYGLYKRAEGYFPNSDFHAEGPPGPEELALLEPLRKQLWRRRSSARCRCRPAPRRPRACARTCARRAALLAAGRLDLPRRRAAQCQGRALRLRVPQQPALGQPADPADAGRPAKAGHRDAGAQCRRLALQRRAWTTSSSR